MKLELSQSLQQQQVLAPQMILSMDILLLPSLDLEQRVRQEFAENPALEVVDRQLTREDLPTKSSDDRVSDSTEMFARLENLGNHPHLNSSGAPRKRNTGESDSKYEALQNTEGRPPGLKDHLTQQIHLRAASKEVQDVAEEIVGNLDHRGYLLCPSVELREVMAEEVGEEVFDSALSLVRMLDPSGVGADDLKSCLLIQLERDLQEYPLETEIIESHLLDLGQNRLPKIAKELGKTIEEIKDAVEIISCLDPIPGTRIESEPTIYIRPDVAVDVLDDEIFLRIENGDIPDLQISESCRSVLKASRGNREVTDFVRKKIDTAQWLIQAIEQRRRTLQDISAAVVEYQRDFMIQGPDHLKALKMQTIADMVGVHISTISRAIKGKHIQTPHGLYELRYFFTGGVGNADGEVESRRNIYSMIEQIIESEDKAKPLSDSAIARQLQTDGLQIARRTVTKYREQKGIPSSRLRKSY